MKIMDDFDTLQGQWRQVRLEANGIIDPPDDHGGHGAITIIEGDTFSVRRERGEVLLAGHFVLDTTKQPKSITWIDSMGDDAGKRLPASYVLDDDQFLFIAADEGMAQPTAFVTSAGLTLRGFVRHRP